MCANSLNMFDDRLEIYSPGGMFDGSRVQDLDLMNVPSKRRNPVLADIFNRLKYMDRRGSGFKKILTDYKNQNNFKEELRPSFNSGFGSFTLTLYNLNYGIPELSGTQGGTQGKHDIVQDDTRNVHQRRQGDTQEKQDTVQVAVQDGAKNVHQDVHQENLDMVQDTVQDDNQNVHQGKQDVHQDNEKNNIEKIIISMIKKDNKITLQKMAQKAGVNEKTIRRYLKKMNNIKYVGSGYSGHWKIVKDK